MQFRSKQTLSYAPVIAQFWLLGVGEYFLDIMLWVTWSGFHGVSWVTIRLRWTRDPRTQRQSICNSKRARMRLLHAAACSRALWSF